MGDRISKTETSKGLTTVLKRGMGRKRQLKGEKKGETGKKKELSKKTRLLSVMKKGAGSV